MRHSDEEVTFSWTDMGWGPEYGRWRYQLLSESEVTLQLSRYANPEYDTTAALASVTFQPCLNEDERSQDRRVAQSWDFGSGTWSFAAVFDGHAGHETADHAMVQLPALLKHKLQSALSTSDDTSPLLPDVVSSILTDAIVEYDKALLTDLSTLFVGGLDGLSELSPSEIEYIINDADRGGGNLKKVHRCMRGSTVLISLVDPTAENLWVANLGDCQAVLGRKSADGQWEARLLTSNHNGSNDAEVKRVMDEHPGEPECIMRRRVLGAITVTRALGDYEFKLPARITEDLFLRAKPGFNFKISSVSDWIGRNKTPPYISRSPEVCHLKTTKSRGENKSDISDAFLMMYTDGLTDLYDRKPHWDVIPRWAKIVGPVVERDAGENAALALLRDALGGDDLDKVSRLMTLENTQRWMDDTTITVQKL